MLRVVGSRVDAFWIAFRVDVSDGVRSELQKRVKVAREHGRASVRVGKLFGEMRYSRGAAHVYRVRNARFSANIDLHAPGGSGEHDSDGRNDPGWTLQIIWSAQALAEMGDVTQAVDESRQIAESIGRCLAGRVQRFDLAADVAGWRLSPADARRLVKRSRAKLSDHPWSLDDDGERRELQAGATIHEQRKIEGITVCPGGTLLARFYDKRKEIEDARDAQRLAAESERWRAGGWDGEAPITRVEFQVRGSAVAEFGARDPERPFDPKTGEVFDKLADVLDRIWQRCLRWVRMVRHDATRASRCSDDPRWVLLRGVSFTKHLVTEVHGRMRQRMGATIEQAIGCVLSVLGARGRLAYKPTAPIDAGPVIVEGIVRGTLRDWCEDAADAMSRHTLERYGPTKALEHLAVVGNAVRERFAHA